MLKRRHNNKKMLKRRFKDGSQDGFSLLEVLIAMFITIVGVTAVAMMIAYGVGLQVLSRDSTMGNALAREKIEELRVTDRSHASLAVGGNLNSNVANYFDTSGGFTRRWLVAAGLAGTLDVTVRVIPADITAATTVNVRVLLENN